MSRNVMIDFNMPYSVCTIFNTAAEQQADNELPLKMIKLNHIF